MVKKILEKSYLYIVLCLLYLPILLIILFSFFDTERFSFVNGFSLGAYVSMINSAALGEALKNTFIIAAISSILATVIGSFAAIGIYNLKRRFRRLAEELNQLPVINAEIVMAVSFLIFFSTFHFPVGFPRLIIAHVAFCTPYVVLSVMPRLMQMDANVYEAAMDLGANPLRATVTVLLPQMVPGIISGFVMALTLSIDDFIITQINKGTEGIETLSTFIYEDAKRKGLEPFWFAVFSIIFVVVLGILLFINMQNTKKAVKQSKKIDAEKKAV